MPADSRPAKPGNPTSYQRLVGLTLAEPKRFPPVSNPMRHLVMTVAHLAVRMAFAAAVFPVNRTHSHSLYLQTLGAESANKFPGAEFSNCQVAKSLALPRRQPLLHYDSVDLPFIWNDSFKRASLLWPASAPLQCVQDIFQTVIYVVHREARTPNV